MSIHLYKHNEDAYRAVETMLEEKQMAAVIHPTGTGKSMIAFKLVEQHPHKHFLWLSPSEYIYKTQLENIDTQFSNIEYMSYSRLMKHEDSIDTLHPDYIILDEFHRCGAAEWGKSVRKLLEAYPKAKRLGLSATNIRYLDNQRNMAEELFEGNIASEMTLGEAIVREILPEPKYVIAMYSYKKELEQLKKRIEGLSNPGLISENEKLLEQLKRALEQADGLTEVFARQMTKPDETAHDVTLRYDDNAPDVVVATLKLVNVPTEPKLPQTGDNANPLLYLGIGALALITGVGVGLRGRKKKNKQ